MPGRGGDKPPVTEPPAGGGLALPPGYAKIATMSLERPLPPDPYDHLPAVPAFTLTSNDLVEGKPIDTRFAHSSVGGANFSPHLSWSGFPEATRSFTVTCLDPDAPTGSGFWHWVAVDLPASVTELATGAERPEGAFHARNDFGEAAYGGPAPPPGDRPHRYIFVVHAVDVPTLGVTPDTPPAAVGFHLAFHTLARATLRGVFQIP